MEKIEKLLRILQKNEDITQRNLSVETGFSLGMVNSLIKQMEDRKVILVDHVGKRKKYSLTKKGEAFLENTIRENLLTTLSLQNDENNMLNTAVILAAGRNSNFKEPIGLLEIDDQGTTLIGRTIEILRQSNITNIIIVVGYKKSMYEQYLKDDNVTIVTNDRYQWTGTMHSLSLVKEFLKDNFLLIEADHVFEKNMITKLTSTPTPNCFMLKNPLGDGNDAYVELDEKGNLFKISKDVRQLNSLNASLSGIHKISYELFLKLYEQYKKTENPYINYEYVLENLARYYFVDTLFDSNLICIDINSQEIYESVKIKYIHKILKKEKEFDEIWLKNLFAEIMDIANDDIQSIESAGGLTNTNYKVITKEDSYILRIPGKCSSEMVSRKKEKFHSKIAYLLNINVDTIYFNEDSGIKITKYVENAETLQPQSIKQENNILLTTKLLRILHESKVDFLETFDYENELLKYESLVNEANGSFYDGYDAIKKSYLRLCKRLNELGVEKKPCHNDLVAENFIKNEKRMYLIDWEYSGYNDPMWDFAAHFLECDFSEKEEELFCLYYYEGQEIQSKQREKIFIFKIIQDILWSVWTMAKEANGEDFGQYGYQRYARAKRLLKEDEKGEKNEIR